MNLYILKKDWLGKQNTFQFSVDFIAQCKIFLSFCTIWFFQFNKFFAKKDKIQQVWKCTLATVKKRRPQKIDTIYFRSQFFRYKYRSFQAMQRIRSNYLKTIRLQSKRRVKALRKLRAESIRPRSQSIFLRSQSVNMIDRYRSKSIAYVDFIRSKSVKILTVSFECDPTKPTLTALVKLNTLNFRAKIQYHTSNVKLKRRQITL